MAEAQKDSNGKQKLREQIFYEIFHPKWVAAMQHKGISVERFSQRAVSLNLIGEKTIPNWHSGKTRSPLSGDFGGAIEVVLKTFASFLKEDLGDLYVLVNHGWSRERFWKTVKGRTLAVKGQWVLSPIPNDVEPTWGDYSELIQRLTHASSPINPTHMVGFIEMQSGQAAVHLNVLRNHGSVIDAFSVIYHQSVDVSDMAWIAFGSDLKQEVATATKEASRPALIVLAGVEPKHLDRLHHFLKIIRGNEYVYLITTLSDEVLDNLVVPKQFQYDFRPPESRKQFSSHENDQTTQSSRGDNPTHQTDIANQGSKASSNKNAAPVISEESTRALIRLSNNLSSSYSFSVNALAFGLNCDKNKAQSLLDEWQYIGWAQSSASTHGLDVFTVTDFARKELKRVLNRQPGLAKAPRILFDEMPSRLKQITPFTLPYSGTAVSRLDAPTNNLGVSHYAFAKTHLVWRISTLDATLEMLKKHDRFLAIDYLSTILELEQHTRNSKRMFWITLTILILLPIAIGLLVALWSAQAVWLLLPFVLAIITFLWTYQINYQLARAWYVLWSEMGLRWNW